MQRVVDRTPEEEYHPRPLNAGEEEESWESVITLARLAEWYDTEDEDDSSSEEDHEDDFLERWDALEEELEKRRKHLQRATKRLASSFQRQIWDRERQIANRKRQLLLEKEVKKLDRAEVKERLKKAGWNVDQYTANGDKPEKTPFHQQFIDWIIYEVNTFLPALLGLSLHSISMACFFEIIETFLQKLLSTVTVSYRSESVLVQSLVYVPSLMVGLLALRCTGYLYWWLSDQDMDCLKLDYHNRLRLGFRGAQFIHKVRSNSLVRMIVYMISYNLCYITVTDMYEKLPCIWGDPIANQLVDLPSSSAPDASLTTNGFACLLPCNEEIARRDAIDAMMLEADFDYTSETLPYDAHVRYWLNYVYRHDYLSAEKAEQLTASWQGSLLQIVLVFTTTLVMMRLYGFVFWMTY